MVEKVIIPHCLAFIQSNSNQTSFMDNNMRTNRDIIVNIVLKKPEIIPWVSLLSSRHG